MAKVTDANGQQATGEEAKAALVALGMTEEYADFVIAMEAGEVDGDVVVVPDTDTDPQP